MGSRRSAYPAVYVPGIEGAGNRLFHRLVRRDIGNGAIVTGGVLESFAAKSKQVIREIACLAGLVFLPVRAGSRWY